MTSPTPVFAPGRSTIAETPFKGFVTLLKLNVPNQGFPSIVMVASNSVVGLLYDATNDRVLLVNQQRPAMETEENPDGSITELVAGRFDVNLGPVALLIKEAKEEAGVTLTEDDVLEINDGVPMALSAGVLTERCYGVFAEISMDQVEEGDEGYGVEAEGEQISRVWQDADEFVNGVHDCWRVYAMAQFLARRRLEAKIAQLEADLASR